MWHRDVEPHSVHSAKAGIQFFLQFLSSQPKLWVPAFAGTSGDNSKTPAALAQPGSVRTCRSIIEAHLHRDAALALDVGRLAEQSEQPGLQRLLLLRRDALREARAPRDRSHSAPARRGRALSGRALLAADASACSARSRPPTSRSVPSSSPLLASAPARPWRSRAHRPARAARSGFRASRPLPATRAGAAVIGLRREILHAVQHGQNVGIERLRA